MTSPEPSDVRSGRKRVCPSGFAEFAGSPLQGARARVSLALSKADLALSGRPST
jgi:hypothetical protein